MPLSIRRAIASASSTSPPEDRRRQPVVGVVGHPHRLVGAVDPDDRHHRPERLLAVQAHRGRDTGEHRRRDDVAVGLSARRRLGAVLARVGDQLEDPLARGVVDHGANHRARVARIAAHELRCPLGELVPRLAGDGAVGDDPLRRHADLAGVHERAEARRVGGRVEVGVGQHDLGRLAAELEQASLELLGALDGDDPAHARGAREVHPPHRGMGDQRVDDLRRPPSAEWATKLIAPAGSPASAIARATAACVRGHFSEPFSTTVLP